MSCIGKSGGLVMVKPRPIYQAYPAGQFVVKLLTHPDRLHFPREVARALWGMIAASDDPEAAAFVFETTRLIDHVRVQDASAQDAVAHYFQAWLTPSLVEAAITELADRGELSPSAAARLRHQVEMWSSREGAWTW